MSNDKRRPGSADANQSLLASIESNLPSWRATCASTDPLRLSRRSFVSLGAIATAAASAPNWAGPRPITLGEQLEWRSVGESIELLAGGRQIWRIARKVFAGAPRFELFQSADQLRLTMWNGRFAGSDSKMDLEMLLERAAHHWSLTLRSSLLQDPVSADLEDWLNDVVELRGQLARSLTFFIGEQGEIAVGPGDLVIGPDMVHTVSGSASRLLLRNGLRLDVAVVAIAPGSRRSVRQENPDATLTLQGLRAPGTQDSVFALGDAALALSVQDAFNGRFVVAEPTDGRMESRLVLEPALAQTRISYRAAPDDSAVPTVSLPRFALITEDSYQNVGTRLFAQADAGEARWFHSEYLAMSAEVDANRPIASDAASDVDAGSGLRVRALRVALPGVDHAELVPLDGRSVACTAHTFKCGKKKTCIDLSVFRLNVIRASDLVDLGFTFSGGMLEIGRRESRLVAKPGETLLIRVHFPPQSIAEQAYFVREHHNGDEPPDMNDERWADILAIALKTCDLDTNDPEYQRKAKDCFLEYLGENERNEFDTRPANELIPETRASRESRLVFAPPVPHLPWTAAALLRWPDWPLVLAPRAAPVGLSYEQQLELAVRDLVAPTPNQTSIEIPFRMSMSPIPHAVEVNGDRTLSTTQSWWTPPSPDRQSIVPMWHAALRNVDLRAVWAADIETASYAYRNRTGHCAGKDGETSQPHPMPEKGDFRLGLNARDRHELVGLTSIFGLPAFPGTPGVLAPTDLANPCPKGEPGVDCDPTSTDRPNHGHIFSPTPVATELLALSSFGGYLRGRGRWEPPTSAGAWQSLSVEDWTVCIPWGREQLQKVVYKGFLFPLGIRASLVKLTERKFHRDPIDGRVKAVLLQRLFIVLPRKPKQYPAIEEPFGGRESELSEVRFLVDRTPDLVDPNERPSVGGITIYESWLQDDVLGPHGQNIFWPRVNKAERYRFRYEALDKGGHRTERESALIFVSNTAATDPDLDLVEKLVTYYNEIHGVTASDPRMPILADRSVRVTGGRVGYAARAADGQRQADTAFETRSIVLKALTPCDHVYLNDASSPANCACAGDKPNLTVEMNAASQPPFYPAVDYASVVIPAISQLSGASAPDSQIGYFRTYVEYGFDPVKNQAEIFALMRANAGAQLDVSGNGIKAGGVATPNTRLIALSRRLGLVGGNANTENSDTSKALASTRSGKTVRLEAGPEIERLAQGAFDPVAFFSGAVGDPKLLGTIRISDVLKAVLNQLDVVPEFIEEAAYALSEAMCSDGFWQGLKRALQTARGTITEAMPGGQSPAVDGLVARILGLEAAVGKIQSLCAELDATTGSKDALSLRVASEIAHLARGAASLVAELRRIAADPMSLLPKELRELYEELMKLAQCVQPPHTECGPYQLLVHQLTKGVVEAAKRQLALIEAQAKDKLDRLVRHLGRHPAVIEVLKRAARLEAELAELQDDTEEFVARAFGKVVEYLLSLIETFERMRRLTNAVCVSTLTQPLGAIITLRGRVATAIGHVHLVNAVAAFETKARRLVADTNLGGSADRRVASAAIELHTAIVDARDELVRNVEAVADPGQGLDAGAVCAALEELLEGDNEAAQKILESFRRVAQSPRRVHQMVDAIGRIARALEAGLIKDVQQTALDRAVAAAREASQPFADRINELLVLLEIALQRTVEVALVGMKTAETLTYAAAARGAELRSSAIALADQVFGTGNAVSERIAHLSGHVEKDLEGLKDALKKEFVYQRAVAIQVATQTVADLVEPFVEAAIDAVSADAIGLATDLFGGLCRAVSVPGHQLRNVAAGLNDTLSKAKGFVSTGLPAQLVAREVREKVISAADAASLAVSELPTASCSSDLSDLAKLKGWVHGVERLRATVDLTVELVSYALNALARGDINGLIDVRPIADALEDAFRALVPAKLAYRYDWSTALQPYPSSGGDEVFIPGPLDAGEKYHLKLASRIEVPVPGMGGQPVTDLFGEVRNFKLKLLPGFPIFSIQINQVLFESKNGSAPKYKVDIGAVELEGQFNFISKLRDYLFGDDGPYVDLILSPPSIEVGFRIGKDLIQLSPGTALQNVRILIAFRLPFDSRPATFRFRFAERKKPFLLSCGIYGGGGYLEFLATPTKMLSVEGAFEFGAVSAIEFGPLKAAGRIVAGIYFRIGDGDTAVAGYVLAQGAGTLGWFTVSVLLLVQVKSDGKNVTGTAVFSMSFEIGEFVTITFSFEAAYNFKGGGAGGGGEASLGSGLQPLALLPDSERGCEPPGRRGREEIARKRTAARRVWNSQRRSYMHA